MLRNRGHGILVETVWVAFARQCWLCISSVKPKKKKFTPKSVVVSWDDQMWFVFVLSVQAGSSKQENLDGIKESTQPYLLALGTKKNIIHGYVIVLDSFMLFHASLWVHLMLLMNSLRPILCFVSQSAAQHVDFYTNHLYSVPDWCQQGQRVQEYQSYSRTLQSEFSELRGLFLRSLTLRMCLFNIWSWCMRLLPGKGLRLKCGQDGCCLEFGVRNTSTYRTVKLCSTTSLSHVYGVTRTFIWSDFVWELAFIRSPRHHTVRLLTGGGGGWEGGVTG